jgi:hypothetical protein
MSDVVTERKLDDFAVKLFKYFDSQFEAVHSEIAGVRGDVRILQGAVDAYAKQVEIYQQESLVRDLQVERLQRWIEQIAHKVDIKLEY